MPWPNRAPSATQTNVCLLAVTKTRNAQRMPSYAIMIRRMSISALAILIVRLGSHAPIIRIWPVSIWEASQITISYQKTWQDFASIWKKLWKWLKVWCFFAVAAASYSQSVSVFSAASGTTRTARSAANRAASQSAKPGARCKPFAVPSQSNKLGLVSQSRWVRYSSSINKGNRLFSTRFSPWS